MQTSSTIFLSKAAVSKNISFIRNLVGNESRISLVVKANAYGHGIKEYTPIAEAEGIDHFSVFSMDEAIEVDKATKNADVLIMGWIPEEEIETAIQKGYEFFVFDIPRIRNTVEAAKKCGTKAKIHLVVETGMNRLGIKRNDLYRIIDLLTDNLDHLDIMGCCTHLAGPESISNHVRIQNQLKKFYKICNYLKDKGINPKYRHVANSAATLVYPKTRMDLIRIGIMQYGFWPSTEAFIHYVSRRKDKTDPLQRVISWKTEVMSVKNIKTGEFVGYGNYFLATEDMKIAIVPVGYSNGYNRSLSNRGRVLIRGDRCAVIGIVNMNMIMVDVSRLQNVEPGDEVVLIGYQEDLEITVGSFSDISDQLNYEVLSRLPFNIPRKVTD